MSEDKTTNASSDITLFTIGFAEKTAEQFFEKLKLAGARRVVDVRLNNVSQLAGFTKKRDIEYFLRAVADIDYVHLPELAPTKEILNGFKKKQLDWNQYEEQYRRLLEQRRPEEHLTREEFDRACLLCSEPTPERCHRRLAAEYLKNQWNDVTIQHL